MVLTPDQQQVKALLTETITLLCKNGLHFQSEFSIEGLIGITLDQNDVFLISIKESIKCDNSNDSDKSASQSKSEQSTKASPGQLRSKKHVKTTDAGCVDRVTAASQEQLNPTLALNENSVADATDVPDIKVEFSMSNSNKHSQSAFEESLIDDDQLGGTTMALSVSRHSNKQDISRSEFQENIPAVVAGEGRQHSSLEPPPPKRLRSCAIKNSNESSVLDDRGSELPEDAASESRVCKNEPLDVVEIPDDEMESSLNSDNSYLMYMSMYSSGVDGGIADPAYSSQYDLSQISQHSVPGCSSWSSAPRATGLFNNQDKTASNVIEKPRHGYIRASHVTKSVAQTAVVADKATPRPHNELLHMLYRHGKYVCQLCGKRMPRERDLKAHMASKHFMAKDFCCKLCGAEYGYKYNLQQHMKIKHRTHLTDTTTS